MPSSYYQILQITNDATTDQIEKAYTTQLEKWQNLKEQQQSEHLKERIHKVINHLETAYQTLIDPTRREQYDHNHPTATTDTPTAETTTEQTPPSYTKRKTNKNLLAIALIFLLIAIGIYYYFFCYDTAHTLPQPAVTTEQPTIKKVNEPPPTKQASSSATLQAALAKANEKRKQLAQNPELKALALIIAKQSNKHINAFINYNTKFIGAKASNQNITFRLVVIDGISVSNNLLTTYLNERFVLDNNQICNENHKNNLAKGILYTFAYFNTKGHLLGNYYIDEQVCQSPTTSRIIKKPDNNQLNSIEVLPTDNIDASKKIASEP